MNNFDYHAAARELIMRLEQDGNIEEARKLRAAMENGATGTEILMGLRFYLAEIVMRTPLKGEAQIMASSLLGELNDVLG